MKLYQSIAVLALLGYHNVNAVTLNKMDLQDMVEGAYTWDEKMATHKEVEGAEDQLELKQAV